jgi:hypothetical protein
VGKGLRRSVKVEGHPGRKEKEMRKKIRKKKTKKARPQNMEWIDQKKR